VAAGAHGRSVRGTVALSAAGAGARLEVDLLTRRASIASAHPALVRVGRTVRSSLTAGRVTFAVALDAKAMRALHARRHLALSVRLVLRPRSGPAVTVVRPLLLRAGP